ncbi:MAG: hypothetical protein EAZ57_03945 [Cytophagales bacterium]|nr:MAG: hypothetical protein EAZ57_03945 [Cytophagales bacterium]
MQLVRIAMGLCFFIVTASFLFAQNTSSPVPDIQGYKTSTKVNIDGILDEVVWKEQLPSKQLFTLNFPNDTTLAKSQTEVRVAFDDNFLYVAAICKDASPQKKHVISSLKRDFDWGLNDNFSLYLDPFQDKLNGFSFTVSAMNVQHETMISDGSSYDSSWDTWWLSAVTLTDDHWVVEMAIPFRMLRYKDKSSTWGVNFARNDVKNNQLSTWARVPQAYSSGTLAFCGQLHFAEPIKRVRTNFAIIPYLAGQTNQTFQPQKDSKQSGNSGIDAKVALTSSLNLDLTVNPDFAQVEVDRQVTNLSRFEIFFPERRQFFVENSDLFARFGFRNLRPFFSRRIGIDLDTTTNQIVQNPILYGARLSGKVNKNWRVGGMNLQTASNEKKGIQGQNYTVAAVQRQLFTRSNIAFIGVNRQIFNDKSDERYKRLLGADFNYQSKDNKLWAKVFYHRAFDPSRKAQNHAHAGFLNYRSRKFNIWWNHEFAGENYDINDIGFVSRNAMWRFEPIFEYFMYPKSKKIFRFGLKSYNNLYTNLNRKVTDFYQEVEFSTELLNTVSFTFWAFRDYTYLFFPFNPSNDPTKEKLAADTDYNVNGWAFYANTDVRKRLNGSIYVNYGGYFLGNKLEVNTKMNYRLQPYGSVALDVSYNAIEQPEAYGSNKFWLVAPRVDFSFTRSLFLTTFMQYNTQANNFNLNSRLQWRFKPVSDLFLVYSENYATQDMSRKNRALVLKISYFIVPKR